MEEGFYEGDRQQNYCVTCKKTDPSPVRESAGKWRCSSCNNKLRTKSAGLALSGGGYRAGLFHLGSIWRLNELGWLKRLAEITSVSGGSITAGYLGLRWKHLDFNTEGFAVNFTEEIVQPLRKFFSYSIELESLIAGLAWSYKRKLFGKATLRDLPADGEGPRFTIYATSLQTGVSVRLSHPYIADYNLGSMVETQKIPLAKAVAASCAFPLAMRPVTIKLNPGDWKEWEDQDSNTIDNPIDPEKKEKMRTVICIDDGGVYDNMGLERIWDRYTTVLVSNAGAPYKIEDGLPWPQLKWFMHIRRPIDIINEQVRRLRRRWLYDDFKEGKMQGAYWGIDTHIDPYGTVLERNSCEPPVVADNSTTRSLCSIRTRLNRFSDEEQEQLIDWGYALTDAAMRSYVLEKGAMSGRLPYPERLK